MCNLWSRRPIRNPKNDATAAGEKLLRREDCAGCHVPPLFTNNKVTLALYAFEPLEGAPAGLDILRVSAGTDPGLVLKTRKGTGYYKVPSLRRLVRGHYLHDGFAAAWKKMFDPARLREDYQPKGYPPPGQSTRAVRGHEFGLKLADIERTQLIAFRRT